MAHSGQELLTTGPEPRAMVSTPLHQYNVSFDELSANSSSVPDLHQGFTASGVKTEEPLQWGVLGLCVVIVATAVGNVLVCLAVCWEKRLQNMTNYFLMSLAIADLLVSILVMPLGMVVELYGYFPLHPDMCVIWAGMDVLMCTASIWHMCTMSMDRFFTLKYPMKYGRNKTKTMVALKITFVWFVSLAICSPLCVLGFVDHSNVYQDNQCMPTIRDFVIYGSVFAFYVPLTINVITYVLTIRILCTNQRLMRTIAHKNVQQRPDKKERNGGSSMYTGCYLTPTLYNRYMDRPSMDTSATYNISAGESTLENDSQKEETTKKNSEEPQKTQDSSSPTRDEKTIPVVTEPTVGKADDDEDSSRQDGNDDSDDVFRNLAPMRCMLSVSQPHLPSLTKEVLSPSTSHHSLSMSRVGSHLSVFELQSVKNFECLSAASSLNSMLSKEHPGSTVWSDFDEPDMLEKLSHIEAEMDQCIMTNNNDDDYNGDSDSSENSLRDIPSDIIMDDNVSSGVDTNDETIPMMDNNPNPIPPVRVFSASPSQQGSQSSLDRDHMDNNSGHVQTIEIKPSGCYLYQIDQGNSSLLPRQQADTETNASDISTSRKGSINPQDTSSELILTDYCLSTDDTLSDTMTQSNTSIAMARRFSPHLPQKLKISAARKSTKWTAILKRKKRRMKQKQSGHKGIIMTKRTATNEKKALKVLGIIFAVFVLLWTPFFIVNILLVACEPCMKALPPAMMAAIAWLGYLSSLANPIIYTMFNTSFRKAFYKILTCQYRVCHKGRRTNNPDIMYMTNVSNWHPSDRRNTPTYSNQSALRQR